MLQRATPFGGMWWDGDDAIHRSLLWAPLAGHQAICRMGAGLKSWLLVKNFKRNVFGSQQFATHFMSYNESCSGYCNAAMLLISPDAF